MDSAFIPVVCALIERDGRVLLARRPPHKHLGGCWEFPGGKVEPGETPAAALARELREELGCAVEILRPLPRTRHRYAAAAVELIPFVCRLATGSPEPAPREHTAVAWVETPALARRELAPADLPVLAGYLQTAGKTGGPAAD